MSANSPANHNSTGIPDNKDAFVVIVRTEWNAHIVDKLESGCTGILDTHQISYEIVCVPGAFEIGFAIRNYKNSQKGTPSAFIALGCVLRGDTPHFEYVCRAVTDNIAQLNLSLPCPVVFGVLTIDNEQQGQERIGGVHGHKGEEAAHTAIKMIGLNNRFNKHLSN